MNKPLKDAQIAVRWKAEDILSIDELAEREDRSRSEIVRFFVLWGIEQYKHFGSLRALESTSWKGAKVASIERYARVRLQLLTEAKEENEQTGFTDSEHRPKKIRVR